MRCERSVLELIHSCKQHFDVCLLHGSNQVIIIHWEPHITSLQDSYPTQLGSHRKRPKHPQKTSSTL
ncbi:hypothetical protein COCC4DRAFT_31247 [Bipolaris maydis ATCC 48331]|uniref:Uncharacterized protein n=2 Tax=Cochliobolus heterostrophus TaxID=5016 RepID=M2UI09_COCH5|nr:uncharacterized protein COCC4DRAFT_31247 [Bipolaris maydis ATCC 48331]EMD93301.1 hypothetical protein COCHEDRAFT_1020456 [Bipolaris maydis C5]ENI07250.1 hypothetical protein COCC4DRAFT_31247 [Bipolaris maydis ATCC 48331]